VEDFILYTSRTWSNLAKDLQYKALGPVHGCAFNMHFQHKNKKAQVL